MAKRVNAFIGGSQGQQETGRVGTKGTALENGLKIKNNLVANRYLMVTKMMAKFMKMPGMEMAFSKRADEISQNVGPASLYSS
jgi:hypothetical protein